MLSVMNVLFVLFHLRTLFVVAEGLTLCPFFCYIFLILLESINMLSSFSNTCFKKFFIPIIMQYILNKEYAVFALQIVS